MNHCPHCGSPVSELDRWCGICGGKLEAADAPADVSEFLAAEDEPTVSVRKVPSSGLKIDSGDTLESTAAKAPGKTGDMHEHASGFRLMGSMGSMSFGGVSSPAPIASVSAPEADAASETPRPAAEKAAVEPVVPSEPVPKAPERAASAPAAPVSGPVRVGRLFGSMGERKYRVEDEPAEPLPVIPVPTAPAPAEPVSAPARDDGGTAGTRVCPACGEIVFSRYTACPACGHPFGGPHKS